MPLIYVTMFTRPFNKTNILCCVCSFFTPLKWGGISSQEHDEAVMLEAALFGGIPEGQYRLPYAPHQFMQNGLDRTVDPYPRPTPRPPSPSLTAQRLIREQQVRNLSWHWFIGCETIIDCVLLQGYIYLT